MAGRRRGRALLFGVRDFGGMRVEIHLHSKAECFAAVRTDERMFLVRVMSDGDSRRYLSVARRTNNRVTWPRAGFVSSSARMNSDRSPRSLVGYLRGFLDHSGKCCSFVQVGYSR